MKFIFEDLPDGSQAIRLNERGEPLIGIRYAKLVVLKVKKFHQHVPDLLRATEEAAGLDITADISEPIELSITKPILIPTGIAIAIPKGYEAQLRLRSGLAIQDGVYMPNGIGTIDSDYRGEIKVPMLATERKVFIKPKQRIAQLVLNKIVLTEPQYVDILEDTVRYDKGFGSTGL